MINIKRFLKENDIEFESDDKALRWIKSLKPNTLVRIGSSFFVDEDEIQKLLQEYLTQQIDLKKKRSLQAKKNFAKKTIKKIFNKTDMENK